MTFSTFLARCSRSVSSCSSVERRASRSASSTEPRAPRSRSCSTSESRSRSICSRWLFMCSTWRSSVVTASSSSCARRCQQEDVPSAAGAGEAMRRRRRGRARARRAPARAGRARPGARRGARSPSSKRARSAAPTSLTGVGRGDALADGQARPRAWRARARAGKPRLALGEDDLGLLLQRRLLALEALLGLLQRGHPVLHRASEPACGLVAGRLFRLCLGVAHGVRPLGMRTYGWSRRLEQAVPAGVPAPRMRDIGGRAARLERRCRHSVGGWAARRATTDTTSGNSDRCRIAREVSARRAPPASEPAFSVLRWALCSRRSPASSPNAPRPREAARLSAAVSQGRVKILCGGDSGPDPGTRGRREGLNLTPRRTDNADADLCPYQPLIPMMFLSPRVTFVPLTGERLATHSRYVKS